MIPQPTGVPRRFRLVRDIDVTGVSGTGHVADGVLWPDGTASVRWLGPHPSIVFWDKAESLERIHGHGGATRIEWADDPDPDVVYIAEVIWFGENPVDGRTRVAVRTTLEGALQALRDRSGDPHLVATEVDRSALGTAQARTWAVHRRGQGPDEEGHLWITEERVASPPGGSESCAHCDCTPRKGIA